MTLIKADAKIKIKRSSVTTEIPTVAPSENHTDGNWSALDIYSGEFFLNEADDRLFIRVGASIKEISLSALGSGAGIYGVSNTLSQNHVATFGAFDLKFEIDNANNGRFFVAPPSVTIPVAPIYFHCPDGNPVTIYGFNGSNGTPALRVANNSGAIISATFYNDGDTVFGVTGALGGSATTGRGRVAIGTVTQTSDAKFIVHSIDNTAGKPNTILEDSSGNVIFQAQNDQRIGIRAMGSTSQTVNIRGLGTGTNVTLVLEDNVGTEHFVVRDNGQIASGADQSAAFSGSTFGHWFQINGTTQSLTYGIGIYPNNCTVGVTIQAKGSTGTALSIATQGSPSGTIYGINSIMSSSAASTAYGIQGAAANATSVSVGVHGQISGGLGTTPSTRVSAVEGNVLTNVNTSYFGGYFYARPNAGGLVLTNDVVGVYARGSIQTAASQGTTGDAYGLQAISDGTTGSGDRIGLLARAEDAPGTNFSILVPATDNDPRVLIGADKANLTSTQVLMELVPGTKAHLLLKPISATTASGITGSDGMIVYVNTTNGTFTAVGFWGYVNGAWTQL